jgi:hypothetical protein
LSGWSSIDAASQRSRIKWTSITENREIKKPVHPVGASAEINLPGTNAFMVCGRNRNAGGVARRRPRRPAIPAVASQRQTPGRTPPDGAKTSVLKVTVAELANTGLDESAVIGHAIETLSAGGEVKFDIPHRIYNVYGRQLSVLGADGSRSAALSDRGQSASW